MAIKYFCDGCDREIPYDDARTVEVTVAVRGTPRHGDGTYELCESCIGHLIENANPKNWVRCAKAA